MDYLQDNLLCKVDRMSMAHSLEVRPPLLDHRIVEFAARLPENFKVRGSATKWILKRAMRGKLPREILNRSKAGLDIPALEPMPADHVLTRSFYLLQDFPGRHAGGGVWVEASPDAAAEAAEGMPFRNLNDGVTPVLIGGNDWAAAWATDDVGVPLVPIGRGFAGERQREIAYRFGINLIMYVLTGNYKSDQVHVPALLERLGQ